MITETNPTGADITITITQDGRKASAGFGESMISRPHLVQDTLEQLRDHFNNHHPEA